jgi:RimJ/RimL family protein N-acetyltransferase
MRSREQFLIPAKRTHPNAPIHQENVASRRVAEKLGMTLNALVDVYGDGVLLANYLMTRQQWLAAPNS